MRKIILTLGLLPIGAASFFFISDQNSSIQEYVSRAYQLVGIQQEQTEQQGNTPNHPPESQKTNETPKVENKTPVPAPVQDVPAVSSQKSVKKATKLTDIDILVNKNVSLPKDYVPSDLVKPKVPFSFQQDLPKKYMRKEAAAALERLFAKAKKEKIDIVGVSAYRSYATQTQIFNWNAKQEGAAKANQTSALPGHSEHQTGLAIDISSKRMNYSLTEKFGETPEGKWLAQNAPAFGFIIRYPKGKEAITGYSYEPWHIRYVGVPIAKEIAAKKITLEEYLLGVPATGVEKSN